MNPWLETIAVCLVALLGISLGRAFSSLRKPYWPLGYLFSCVLIAMLIIARLNDSLIFIPPFSWFTAGRIRFIILGLAVTMGLTTLLSRLPYKFEKFAISISMIIVVIWFSVLPFLVPALIKDSLSKTETVISPNGICYQTTAYTCGPAAAVTALRKLGLPACEGEIAVLSHTSPIVGTLPDCLSSALQNRYRDDGLKCQYRYFDSLDQLRNAGITLAVVKDSLLLDHCVAVLEVSDQLVALADPILGKRLISHENFLKTWRFSGIVLTRDIPESI